MSEQHPEPMNSQSYWDNRFVTDWEINQGREQSRFFGKIAFRLFPEWFTKLIQSNELSVCDWGCAQGDGTEVLGSLLGSCIAGVDFSEQAILKARETYPDLEFFSADFVGSQDETMQFDVIFSSNTLEHFSNPWKIVKSISKNARKFLALLLPFREYDRIDEHFYTFDFRNIPVAIDGWVLVHSAATDTRMEKPSYWNGEQILVIYARASELYDLDLDLDALRIDSPLSRGTGAETSNSSLLLEERYKSVIQDLSDTANALSQIKEDFKKNLDLQENISIALGQHGCTAQSLLCSIQNTVQIKAERDSLSENLIKVEEQFKAEKHAIELKLQRSEEAATAANDRLKAIEAERRDLLALVDTIRTSNSWRVTKPIRLVTRLLRHGVTDSDRQNLTNRVRMLYRRLPLSQHTKAKLRENFKTLVEPIQEARREGLREIKFEFPSVPLTVQDTSKPDYIIWGVIDWHFRHQRPQQLAQALSLSGRRVFYISVNFIDDPRAGYRIEPLDDSKQLFQVRLHARGAPVVYTGSPGIETVMQLRESIGLLLLWAASGEVVSLIQHPFWYDTALVVPNSRSVYDCMDHHEGFGNTAEGILSLEHALMRNADITITTSDWLDKIVAEHTSKRALIRNAGDYQHFSQRPSKIYHDLKNRRVIGYYGAIAEWFDQDLVEKVARQFPETCILLVGADTVGAKSRLGGLPNVEFIGEVPYAMLPFYLYAFDVCLLPFKVIPLTLATNPVKVYEYLGAGKPVVSVDLPEMKQFSDLVYVSEDQDAFITNVAQVLGTQEAIELIDRRREFAEGQTWSHRARDLIASVEATAADPMVSVIVVTYNNIEYTKACLDSLDKYSQYSNLEIIVVDNASADDSPQYLTEWQKQASNRRLILNSDNLGFAAANNQGLKIALGEYMVLLNNDTWVTRGWIRTMVRHLRRDPNIGLIGPVTNNIGNEAKIEISYKDIEEMQRKSAEYVLTHIGQSFPLRTAAFFCVMMPRHVYEVVGPLDEIFGRGFFEDDDYCRRVEQIGLTVVCAQDIFIHHHLSASFGKLKSPERQALFERNKLEYEKKWGKWIPHAYKEHKKT